MAVPSNNNMLTKRLFSDSDHETIFRHNPGSNENHPHTPYIPAVLPILVVFQPHPVQQSSLGRISNSENDQVVWMSHGITHIE